jgi:hypothetical protein
VIAWFSSLKGLPWAPDEPSLAFDGARRLVSAAALATDPGQRCVSQYFPGDEVPYSQRFDCPDFLLLQM